MLLFGLYRMVFPNWDNIKKLHGFPKAGKKLNDHITSRFIEFDKVHHPNVFHGGCWLNHGFSIDDEIGPWEVVPCDFTLKEVGE